MRRPARWLIATLAVVGLGGCAQAPDAASQGMAREQPASAAVATTEAPAPSGATPGAPPVAGAALPTVLVHKSPTCGCCAAWVEHMRENGFTVEVNETEQVEPIKQRLGVPFGKGSCHTAEVGPYFVEGHVPAEDIKRLLAEGGDAKGLVLPGMPIGSPGMEVPDGRVERYTVERVDAQGETHPFAVHGEPGQP